MGAHSSGNPLRPAITRWIEELEVVLNSDVDPDDDPVFRAIQDLGALAKRYPDLVGDIYHDTTLRTRLHKLVVSIESNREAYWSNQIISDPFPATKLMEVRKLPEFSRYPDLLRSELHAARPGNTINPSTILFVGCGAFPLSAVTLAELTNAHITCIDRDEAMLQLASSLISVVGDKVSISNIKGDGWTFDAGDHFDMIWVALLVGENDDDKTSLLEQLSARLTGRQTIVCRTPTSSGRIFYPWVDGSKLAPKIALREISGHHEFISLMVISKNELRCGNVN